MDALAYGRGTGVGQPGTSRRVGQTYQAMQTLKITFPDDLYLIIRERVDIGAYASVSEYIRTLVREDRLRSVAALKRPRNNFPRPRRANDVLLALETERRQE